MQYRRSKVRGGCYFFTLVTQDRRPLLTQPEIIERLREAFRNERVGHPFSIDAIVILPDHLHCLWSLPQDDSDFSGRWRRIKRFVSKGSAFGPRNASQGRKREAGFWQRRFWEHTIRSEADFDRHLDYIHYNPVKHGLVEKVRDWPYSSFARCVERGWYLPDWGSVEPEELGYREPE